MSRQKAVRGRAWLALASIVVIASAGRPSHAEDPVTPGPVAPSIKATQLTVHLENRLFQATVVAKGEDWLTIVTAAHCVAAEDAGTRLWMSQGEHALRGRLLAAAQNPDYKPVPSRDPQNKTVRGVLCVDNAVATIEVKPETPSEQQMFEAIATAELTASLLPRAGVSGTFLTIHVIDQKGVEHVVRAGNHLNPKCLAWGHRSYHPLPGDSGAGVFLFQQPAEGKPRPILIGNVALSDPRGGIAPLLARGSPWFEVALGHGGTHEAK